MPETSPTGLAHSAIARRSWVLATVVALVGSGMSLGLWRRFVRAEQREFETAFQQEAARVQQAVEQDIRLFLDVLNSLRALHTLSEQISDADFEEFVQKGMLHQQHVLGAFGFAQRIPHEMREPMERATDEAGRPGLAIVESDDQGGYRPAAERPDHYPLTYQTPPDALGLPLGFDFASWEAANRAIGLLHVRDGPVLGGPFLPALPTRGREQVGWYVFAPIYQPFANETLLPPPGWLIGFVVAILKPSAILERAVSSDAKENFRVELVDHAATPTTEPLPGNGLMFEGKIQVADREWRLRCLPGPRFSRFRGTGRSDLLLVGGLVLTALIAGQLVLVGLRARTVERLVQVRTIDLRQAHERIQREMEERMRLEDEIHGLAAREQQRVGQDLHDSLGQKLTGAMFLSRGLVRRLVNAGEEEREAARQLNETLKDAVAQVRRMARGLSPVTLGEEGLADALSRLAEDTRQTYGVACAFQPPRRAVGQPPTGLPPPVAEQLYYIAREAVHNAARHSQCRLIRIVLTEEEGRWRLSVEDDGRGLPTDAERSGGLGLPIMRHRASLIDASLEIASRPGGGTVVTCRVEKPRTEG